MSNLKQKISYKVMALFMAVLMLVSMIPATVIAYALDSANESPYKAQNFTAVYNAETDSVDMTWDEFTTEPYELWLCVDTLKTTQLDVAVTKYSYSVVAGGEKTYSLLAFVDDADVEGVESDRIGVTNADTLTSISSFDAAEVENNLTITEIIAKLPTKAKVVTDTLSTLTEYGNSVQWNTEGTSYDQSKSEEQTITISGVVVLDKNSVQNRNDLSLDCTIEVKVKAAVDVSIASDLDDSAPVEKKVGESLALSVEATGTDPEYQWYKKSAEETEGTAINGETAATLNISSLALTDAAQYYCVITGKNESTVTSKIATVNVAKNDVDLQLSISPSAGQTRPNPIEIEVLNVPTDAKGTVTIKQGENEIHNVTLNGSNSAIKYTFKASGSQDTYEFSAIYTGDEEKYNGDEVIGVSYDFTKGKQEITSVSGIPSDIKALDEFTIVPTTVIEPTSNEKVVKYSYDIDDESVATIDNNGKVTTKKAGKFKITITALSDDDYNADVFETEEIVVDYADRSGLSFNDDSIEKVYFSGFNYAGMGYTDNSLGAGDLVFSIERTDIKPKELILIDQNGLIKYADTVDPFNKDSQNLIGDVVVRLTKKSDGVYDEIYTEYTLTIKIANQATLEFAEENITVTYTADANGNALTTGQNIATGGSVNAPIVYSIVSGSDVITLDPTDGSKFTAIKPGTAVVKAEKVGNTFFNKVSDTYTIVVEKGTVVGFNFDETNVENLKTQYGVRFTNKAGVKENGNYGQSNSSAAVSYKITSVSDAIKDYAKVDATGIVYFDGNYALAEDASEYSITIEATKAENEYYVACPIEYTLKVTRDDIDYTKDFTVNGAVIKNAQELTSPEGWYNASHYNKDNDDIIIKPDGTKYTAISEDGKEFFPQITRDADAKYSISFYLKNEETGAVSFATVQKVNYDKTNATAKLTLDENNFWDKFLETITFGIYKASEQDIVVVAKDELSKVSKVEYFIHDNGDADKEYTKTTIKTADIQWEKLSVSEKDENTVEGTVKIKAKDLTIKKAVLYVKVTDNAGNITYLRSNGVVFDIIPPDSNVDIDEENKSLDIEVELSTDVKVTEGLYNTDVPFIVTVKDNANEYGVTSGVKSFTTFIEGIDGYGVAHKKEITVNVKETSKELVEFNSENTPADKFTFEVKIDGEVVENAEYKDAFTVPAEFNSNRISIYVDAIDWSENEASTKDNKKYLAIDIVKPVIDVTYDDEDDTFSNGKYIGNNKNRVATITIEELNFDNSAVKITVKKDGKDLEIAPNFVAVKKTEEVDPFDKNGDQILWTMDIDYATLGEGDFEFDIAYTDKAKNSNVGWTGDKVAVNKSFAIDNTKPVISVEITNDDVKNDKYFAADRKATVTITERNFDENYKFDWNGLTYALDGEVKTAPTPKIIKSDKETYIRVYEIDFSAEGDYTFDVKYTDLADNLADTYSCSSVSYKEFTVDKTAPALEITGVADKSANNGDVAPVVTYSDINFNKDAVSIVLSGINNGKVDYKSNSENHEDNHGQTVKYDNFEEVQKVDDIYTLTAKLTDMAGNETEKTITFSANRFGSVYNLSEVEDIISKYLKVEEDIVFTETNVDSLDRDGIKIKLTKNGTPSDLVEGTDYTVEVTGGNGQWSVYKYTVKKVLFADDGRYSLSIYSKDAAGNINENIDETKSAEISFGIDKTNPVIVPIDFEDGGRYDEETKTVSVEIKDNLVLESVKIYLNGNEIDYEVNGETYTFKIGESNSKQNVKIVAVDAAGNEQPLEVKDFVVNTNFFIQWFYNTPLFVGSIVGVVLLALGITIFLVFFKKKKED